MTAEPFDKASVFWGVMMSSCTLSLHRGQECKDGVSIRPNVPFADSSPEQWQRELSAVRHKQELAPEEARDFLSSLGPMTLLQNVYSSMGQVEMRGATETLKFWITTHSRHGARDLSEVEKSEYKDYLTSVARMLFSDIREEGAPGSSVWK
ncbi:hypothetical protein [Methylorubrum thiocyanatum]|uniref:hypothetical protein n=1 Tax=Methylorubrum thiocyanatum TaxID=47958 RepID=UPI003F7E6BEE